MKKRTVTKRVLAFCFCLLLTAVMALPATAAEVEKTTVRVGYVQMQGFLHQNEDGSYSGLAYDMLQEIGSYNNWSYDFYECGYSEVEQLFADDAIDIFIPYQKTAERTAVFEYSDEVFCTNKASLVTLPDSPISYEDFSNLDRCTIGVVKGTRNGERFRSYLAEHGCHITLKADYVHQQELIDATKAGEIDAFISASNRSITDFKIVSLLPQTESYVIAPKGVRTYLDPIDSALRKIGVEMPGLLQELEGKYLYTTEGSYPSLSQDEQAYIKEKKQVSVLISAQECDSDGNFSAASQTIFDNISTLTGLTFVPVVENDTASLMRDITDGKADIIYTFNRDFDWAEQHQVWPSCSYADFYNQLITKAGRSDIKTVAVVPGSYIAYYVEKNMTYQTVSYPSYQACIEAVLADEADAAYCTAPIGNYYSTFPKYSHLSFLTAYDFKSTYCMAVSQQSDQILVDILNKAILCIPNTALSHTFETQMNARPITFSDVFYSNPVIVGGAMCAILIILLVLAFTLFYSRRIQRKNSQLAVANHAKNDFMSRMSHDMRTPMNGILGLARLSKEETDMAVIQSNLDQIELSGKVLLDLINDTLDMNKIESGNLQLHPVPINSEEVFGNILVNANIMAAEKGVRLNIHTPNIGHGEWVPVIADASRLEQILINVLSNAIKFTPVGGTVDVIMETVSIGDGLVKDRYIIRDTGIGMSPEFVPHMFEEFAQENRDHENADMGSGLGMSIVKRLVELMGGTISVKSALNEGTEITLNMQYPIYEGTLETEALPDTATECRLEGLHVLLCEDHPLNARIAVKLLEKKQMTVDWAEDGKRGTELFAASAVGGYDAVLMDIRMPVMNGLEAAAAIRAMARADAKTVPIIAMTANAYEEDVKKSTEVGMNAHLSKPVEPEKLYSVLAQLIQKKRQSPAYIGDREEQVITR